jgi:hypothetical protein
VKAISFLPLRRMSVGMHNVQKHTSSQLRLRILEIEKEGP